MTAESGTRPVHSQMAKSIWLIGLMGSGKSTVGGVLARSLQVEYVDNDTTIAASVRAGGRRPWLGHEADDVRQTMAAMMADREPRLLHAAHWVIDGSGPVAAVVDRIVTPIRD